MYEIEEWLKGAIGRRLICRYFPMSKTFQVIAETDGGKGIAREHALSIVAARDAVQQWKKIYGEAE